MIYKEIVTKTVNYIEPILKEYGYELRNNPPWSRNHVYTKFYNNIFSSCFSIEPTDIVKNEDDQVFKYKYIGYVGISTYKHFKPTIYTKTTYYSTDITEDLLNNIKESLLLSDYVMKQYIIELKKHKINKDF